MRLLIVSLGLALMLALGVLEIFAARGVSDADVPGGATVRIEPPAERIDAWHERAW